MREIREAINNVRSKADISQLNTSRNQKLKKWKTEKLKSKKTDMLRSIGKQSTLYFLCYVRLHHLR